MIKTKVLIAAMLAAQLVSSAVCAAETGGVGISADIKSDMCLISDSKYCESILLPAGTIKFPLLTAERRGAVLHLILPNMIQAENLHH